MARRKQNPINDIIDAAGAWLGGNRGTINPQVQRTISQTKEVGKVIDQFATGGMGQALVSDAQRMAATGSSTPSALYKTAAVNLGAAAAGYGAAKVAGKVAEKVVESGRIAQAVNRVRGEVVLIHGSPTQGIKTINPTKGPNRGRGTRGVDLGLQGFYGVPSQNPQFGPSQVAMKYALGDQEKNLAQNVVGQGSVYLAKAKKADLIFEQGGKVARTSKPVDVVKELRLSDYPREGTQSLIDDYVAALKKAGGPTVSRGVRKQSRGGGTKKK
jgi:hypothetical protein